MQAWQPLPDAIVTDRLVLGAWRDDDLDDYAAMVAERDRRNASGRVDLDRADLSGRLRRQRSAIADTGIGLYVVRRHGAFVGYCGLILGRGSLDEPELAYELQRTHHGRGFATEAARAVVAAAADSGRRRLWSTVRPKQRSPA